ncbi:MAG: hypothetical protein H7296_01785 [Bacteroidia bacterium]|nr:hypothetical protein [Bacteroidia bacterium]
MLIWSDSLQPPISPSQLRNISEKLLRSNDTILNIGFIRDGQQQQTKIKTYSSEEMNVYWQYVKKDTCFKLFGNNISYLYPGTIKTAYLPELMKTINKTKGLIIDFRCYPSDFIIFTLSEYLLPDSMAFVKFSNGNIITPGLFTMTDVIKAGKKNADYYKGKVVILVNETTQSSAEYHVMAFRKAPKATVVGSTTAGADGNVSMIFLPGGMRTGISGIGVYYPDGRETQRIGIIPDVEVKPTVTGIRAKKDEVLERALEIINAK